jgi:hypothetical protein
MIDVRPVERSPNNPLSQAYAQQRFLIDQDGALTNSLILNRHLAIINTTTPITSDGEENIHA